MKSVHKIYKTKIVASSEEKKILKVGSRRFIEDDLFGIVVMGANIFMRDL